MNSREWQDPHFLEKGREKERAYYVPFENTEKALTGEREKSGEFHLPPSRALHQSGIQPDPECIHSAHEK